MSCEMDASALTAWEVALGEVKDSPGCFGTVEFMSAVSTRTDGTIDVHSVNGVVIPVKTSMVRRWGFFRKRIIQSAPINGLLGNPVKESAEPILGHLDRLSREGELILHVSEPWNNLLESRLLSKGFALSGETRSHRVDLPESYEGWFKLKGVQRDVIRKGEKSGLVVKLFGVEGLEQFYYLYRLSVRRWVGKGKRASPSPISRFSRLFELTEGRYTIYAAFCPEVSSPIAAAIVGVMGQVATYGFGATDVSYGSLRPANYLHAFVIKNLIERGVHTYVLGMSNNDRNIERFKEHLGAYSYPVFVYTRRME
jgi:hypothetical protein